MRTYHVVVTLLIYLTEVGCTASDEARSTSEIGGSSALGGERQTNGAGGDALTATGGTRTQSTRASSGGTSSGGTLSGDMSSPSGGTPNGGTAGNPVTSSFGGSTLSNSGTTVPNILSETGLFADDGKSLNPDVVEFRPRFELWADGAAKRRFLFLPAGTQIDTTDPNYFRFPIGTKVWKEFSVDGVRIETRLIEKVSSRKFRMVAFLWRDDGSDADAIPAGLANAHGTTHDVPSETDCVTCHQNQPDKYAGLGAIQLDHELGGVTLSDLAAMGKLSVPVPSARTLPGDATAQQALGILHVNCGTCHNSQSVLPYRGLDLWLRVSDLGRVEDTSFYRTALGVVSGSRPVDSIPNFMAVAGHPEQSAIIYRMGARGSNVAMPPLGSKSVDTQAVETVSAFILNLH